MTLPVLLHVICLAAVLHTACGEAKTGAFTMNVVQGGDSTVSGAYDYWSVGSDCEMDGGDFSVKDTCVIGCNQDCYMTQTIDITFARNYLLNPGGRVMISMQGFIQGGSPDYASLTLTLLECMSGNLMYSLGGNQLTSSSWNTYTWGMRLAPNICTMSVQLYLKNHHLDGDAPSAQTISVFLTGIPATQSAALPVTTSVTKSEEYSTPTCSLTPIMTQTATLSVDAPTPSLTLSPDLSPSPLTSSRSVTSDQSTSSSRDTTASLSATSTVTTTGALTETLGLLTVSQTMTKTQSANDSSDTGHLTVTASATVSATRTRYKLPTVTRSNTNNTLQHSTSHSPVLPLTTTPTVLPTPTITWALQLPTKEAPITVAAAVSLATAASAAILLAASTAAGPATMQAIISNSACGMGNGTTSAADSPTMYLVSPFIGDSFAMVGGNIGLVFGVLLLHVLVLQVARQTKTGRRSPRAAAALVRFPQIALLFANLAVQGTMLGGWQLLWLAIRGESNNGSVKYVVCFVLAIFVPALLIAALWTLRVAIVTPSSCSTFWRVSVAGRTRIHAKRISYDAVGLSGLLISRPWLRSLMRHAGPTHLWTPRPHRLMFGAAVSDSGPHSALELRWLLLKNYVVPLVITAASAVRPPDDHRAPVCAAAMSLTAVVMFAVGATALWQRPFRTQFKNIFWPVSLFLIGLTALLSQPAVVSGMGDNTTTIVLGVISLVQSVTQAVAITLTCLVFLFVERRAAELVDGLPPSSCDDDDDSTATTASTAAMIISELEMPFFAPMMTHNSYAEANEEMKVINPLLDDIDIDFIGISAVVDNSAGSRAQLPRNRRNRQVVSTSSLNQDRSLGNNNSNSSATNILEYLNERLDHIAAASSSCDEELDKLWLEQQQHCDYDSGLGLLGPGAAVATSDLLLGYHSLPFTIGREGNRITTQVQQSLSSLDVLADDTL